MITTPHVSDRSFPTLRRDRLWLILVCCLLITGVLSSFLIPEYTYWRDSPEFLIGAFFLDIMHPVGSPLYVQLANLFALVPLGPITARINGFSLCIALCLLVGCGTAVFGGLSSRGLPRTLAAAGTAASMLAILSSSAFYRQALVAEVYLLGTFLCFLLALFTTLYVRSGDARWIITAAFVGGLGIGNHIAIALSILLVAAILLTAHQQTRRLVPHCLAAGLAGVMIFGFLPARSSEQLPLNTGDPRSIEAFVRHITNARDRELRQLEPSPQISVAASLDTVGPLRRVALDVSRLVTEAGAVAAAAGLIGLLILLCTAPLFACIAASLIAATLSFFSGWDVDPWIPAVTVLAFLAAVPLARLGSSHRPVTAWIAAAALAASAFPRIAQSFSQNLATFDAAERLTEERLAPLPLHPVLLTESAWFLDRYLTRVVGFRPDISVVYIPAAMFPSYIAPQRFLLTDSAGGSQEFSTASLLHTVTAPNTVQARLAAFLTTVARRTTVFYDPPPAFSATFRGIFVPNANGFFQVGPPLAEPAARERQDALVKAVQRHFRSLNQIAIERGGQIGADTRYHLALHLLGYGDALESSGQPISAYSLLAGVCTPVAGRNCPLEVVNNMAVYALRAEDPRRALRLLNALRVRPEAWEHPRVQENIRAAEAALASNAVGGPPESKITP